MASASGRARDEKRLVTVKTAVSRFQIHDELTAPDESAPLIKTIANAIQTSPYSWS